MITYAELKKFVEIKGNKFELNPIKSEYDGIDLVDGEIKSVKKEYITGYYLGINNLACRKGKSEWQWTWFKTISEELNDDTIFWFEERYSMINGKSYKGTLMGIDAEESIRKRVS